MSRLVYSDKEKYILEFEDRDAYLQNFKRTIENYFTDECVLNKVNVFSVMFLRLINKSFTCSSS
jgi:hypothetical protein